MKSLPFIGKFVGILRQYNLSIQSMEIKTIIYTGEMLNMIGYQAFKDA